MDVIGNSPVSLAERRLAWLDARQKLLARNVANADTPGFRPSDAVPFQAVLARRQAAAGLLTTDARHLTPARQASLALEARRVSERTPNGNAVSLDEQAVRIAETDQAHALAMGLHRKYIGLFRMTLGR
ncbi:flagellar basal body protein [Roseococcus sp. SDR]|uniref:flagellar basal body rod protein FlgB n=1 Tax=Roseococcus sp. SDR TaxID=2835532 RepID=UPI001BCBEB03|nr:flagellar basal body protein [Roseococcus sp. SDR]MBS7788626.1 flagellar biosynthesis protein FlgB [Roseococcus sp. SDR]MBV1843940.1 flagellar basal body protein [Roseococcus sp. SDR]